MKKVSFFPVLFCVFLCFLQLIAGCTSSPSSPLSSSSSSSSSPSSSNNESSPVWGLLKKGDNKARGYFMGEIDIDAVDSNGRTPLHYAAERKDVELAKFFLSLGANPNIIDNNGQTPLGICVENNDPQTAAVLAAGGADIHQPITSAGNKTAGILALEKSPSVFNAILNPDTLSAVDASGKTILHQAIIAGNIDAVTKILSISSPSAPLINKKDFANKNSLDYALERADSKTHIIIAEQLILAGGYCDHPIFAYFGPAVSSGNYNIRRNEGLAPIHHAVMGNHTGLVTFLLERNIDINIKTTSGATSLHEAVRVGNIDIITMLINSNADVNAKDASGNTPLHVGIPSNVYLDVISILLSGGAEVNLRDDHGDTPLHIAVMLNRSVESVQLLLDSGSDVHIRNINGKTPLFIAVQEQRFALIPLLLASGSEIFATDNNGITLFDISVRANDATFELLVTGDTINQRDSQGNTVLHCAVINRGNIKQIAFILDQRSPVDSRNRDGDTALHIAVRTNQKESGEYLLVRGANIFSLNSKGESPLYLALGTGNSYEWIINSTTINAKDGLGNTMLHYAAEWELNNSIPIMIKSGINVDTQNATGQTPLFMAVKSDNLQTIRLFIENNASLNARDSQGNTALHAAVRWNTAKAASFLLSSGIDINAHSFNGNTPIHDAVILKSSEIESLLIRQKADLESKNIEGNTPLMEATICGLLASVEKLSSGGADTSTRNIQGDTPLHIAVDMERIDIVNVLLRTGVSIHARNTKNRTPFQISLSKSPQMAAALLGNNRILIPDDFGNSVLHIALLEKSSDEIIRAIINQGAKINVVDNNGKTPLRLAIDLENWPAVKTIADSGADPFLAAVDNKSPAEISFIKGQMCIRAVFSGKAINAKDSSGNTILHLAARLGSPEIISILYELGANKTIKNTSSESPSDIAVRWNRKEVSELLR